MASSAAAAPLSPVMQLAVALHDKIAVMFASLNQCPQHVARLRTCTGR